MPNINSDATGIDILFAFYEQAFRPVPQENSVFVEQAGKPVADNDARCEVNPILFVMQDLRSIFD